LAAALFLFGADGFLAGALLECCWVVVERPECDGGVWVLEGCWVVVEPPECEVGVWVLDGVVEVVPGCVVLVGWVVAVGVEVQESETDWIGPVTGSWIEDSGVPGGTLTLKLSFWPPTRVTVTTHVSAEAVGMAAIAPTPSADANDVTATTSFRLLNTAADLLPP
jgi:hypothetical protein